MTSTSSMFQQSFFHGTRADLQPGDLIKPGHRSNFGNRDPATYVYFTATLDAAIWGAELASGQGRSRIYVVEPTGPLTDDPNLTDKKFPGNPTRSYRSHDPLRITGEVVHWRGHSPEALRAMKEHLEHLERTGAAIVE
jgi:rifampin ADP-ribosylating transferase